MKKLLILIIYVGLTGCASTPVSSPEVIRYCQQVCESAGQKLFEVKAESECICYHKREPYFLNRSINR